MFQNLIRLLSGLSLCIATIKNIYKFWQMNQESNVNVDALLKWISALYILLTVGGTVYLYMYYWLFKINIFQYIAIGEVILLFIEMIPLLIVTVILNILAYVVFMRKSMDIQDLLEELRVLQKGTKEYEIKRKTLLQLIRRSVQTLLVLLPILIISGSFLPNEFNRDYSKIANILMISLPVFLFFTITYIPNLWLQRMFKITLSRKKRFYFLGLILYFTAVANFSFENGEKVISYNRKKPDAKYEFIYKDQKVVTDDSLAFIGRTHNYIFLYDRTKKATRVFEKEEVKDFVVIKL